jgi:hypothetical protein
VFGFVLQFLQQDFLQFHLNTHFSRFCEVELGEFLWSPFEQDARVDTLALAQREWLAVCLGRCLDRETSNEPFTAFQPPFAFFSASPLPIA